jgi:hypothetical protein
MGSERWVERTAVASERRLLLALAAALAAAVACVYLTLTGVVGPAGAVLLVALVVLTRMYVGLQVDITGMKRRGANAEAEVGRLLDSLVSEGYAVLHDLQSVLPGNVDHVVCGPTGALLIETKSRTFRTSDLTRTKDAARRVAAQTGTRFVIPVICLHLRPDVQWRQDGVDVVGIDRLADFIRSRRQPPCDLAAFMGLAGRG